MTDANGLDIGVVGLGTAGTGLAAEVRAAEGATLAAIAEVDADQRRRAGDRFELSAASRYAEYESMLDAVPLDAVVIATPPGAHYGQLRPAFDRDLHVLCEKPFVTTVADSRDILSRDEARAELLMVGYQRHLQPAYVRARTRWADGDATPRFLTAELTQDWSGYFEAGTNWRLDPERSGGGHLFNVGTHVVDAVLWTAGLTPESVAAEMTFYDGPGADNDEPSSDESEPSIDQQSSVLVRFENGSLAAIADTGLAHAHDEHVHAWDDRGTVRITASDWGRPRLVATDRDGGTSETGPDEDSPSRVDAFVAAIRDGTEPPATARDAHRTTAVLAAAYEAARRGERVAVEG